MTTYDIEGTFKSLVITLSSSFLGEAFDAVFLSTAEPTDENARSKNMTKSPCYQYVFNTAITCSKSLVVCTGNPFLLVKIESHMNNDVDCWREYIRRCILMKCFCVHPNANVPDKNELQALLALVFPQQYQIGSKCQSKKSISDAYQAYQNDDHDSVKHPMS